MNKRWLTIMLTVLVLVSMFFPFIQLHPHTQLEAELSAQFPSSLSGYEIMLSDVKALPVDSMPSLSILSFQGWAFGLGLILMLISGILYIINKKSTLYIAIISALSSVLVLFYASLHLQNISNTLVFQLLLTIQGWAWIPVVLAALNAFVVFLDLRHHENVSITSVAFRKIGGVLCLLSLLCMLLPHVVSGVPLGFVDDANSVQAMNQQENLWTSMMGDSPQLSTIAKDNNVFADVLTADLAELESLSGDATNIKGIFTIKTNTASIDILLLFSILLLLLAGILSFIPKVDKWFPLSISTIGVLLIAIRVTSLLTINAGDMFTTAAKQLAYIGVGHVTIAPIVLLLLAICAALSHLLGLQYSDSPYFENPLPEGVRIRVVAAALAIISFVFLMLPTTTFSFYKPGMTKVQSTVELYGLGTVIGHEPDNILHPTDSKGKLLYQEEEKGNGFNDASIETTMSGLLSQIQWVTILSAVLCALGIIALLMKKDKRISMTMFLATAVLRIVHWLIVSSGMPQNIGTANGTALLYVSIGTLVFAAFFSNFAHMKALPKKYRLFLMMLPFLVAVFLFSYLPLYGWSYSFYNYKFGLPMSQQEFVGLKWFAEIFTNVGMRNNMIRVMQNTFAMSGLGLLTSWMPMVFAILLNEVSRAKFKKFVQIFTTLPNFISWALVFSFAMTIFSLDTGIFNKFLLSIGAIDQPIAWLNSGNHMWLKMWGWSTWKGLGWGAIMYLAAIAGIDQELYEAARVDGAGRWKQIQFITLPGLLPTFFVLLLLSISNLINNGMEQYLVFQNSMNKDTIEVLDLFVYNITIASKGTSLYSFGTAIGILKTIFSVTLLFGANYASKKLRGESIV